MAEHGVDREEVFVVRFWQDRTRLDDTQPWRGCVDHVPSGQRRFFVGFQALSEFVGSCLSETSKKPSPEDA